MTWPCESNYRAIINLTDERVEKLQIQARLMVQFPGPTGEAYRHLMAKGKYFEKDPSDSETCGKAKECFHNALKSEGEMYCGYAMTADLSFPVAHCWNMKNGQVLDTTPVFNDSKAFYYGIPISKKVALEVVQTNAHGNEFMDMWRTAVTKVSEAQANRWRAELGW